MSSGYFVDESVYARSQQPGVWPARSQPLTFGNGNLVSARDVLPVNWPFQIGVQLYGDPDVVTNFALPNVTIDWRPSPTWDAVNNRYSPPSPGIVYLRQGGGIQNLTVTGQFLLGDPQGLAEAWGYEWLSWLGGSYAGELMIHNQAYRNCYFQSGVWTMVPSIGYDPNVGGSIYHSMVSYELQFIRPIPYINYLTDPPTWNTPSLQLQPTRYDWANYHAVLCDVNLNVVGPNVWLGREWLGDEGASLIQREGYADIRSISVQRPSLIAEIPRVQGAYVIDLPRARTMTLQVEHWKHAQWGLGFFTSRKELEEVAHNLHANIQDKPLVLTGNGNTFSGCHLQAMELGEFGAFAAQFRTTIAVKDYGT